MFLKDKNSGDMVEVLDMGALVDPFQGDVKGRFHVGEEMQDARQFNKPELSFPSGEALPRCWTDKEYRSSP
ncbi:MAG: acetyltransferase [Gammaproteobacteria bacterium]|nr:acetyltransferase [Gammaproteobacteria bacterium]